MRALLLLFLSCLVWQGLASGDSHISTAKQDLESAFSTSMGTMYTDIIEVIQIARVAQLGNDSVVFIVVLITEIPPEHKALNFINDVPVEYKFSQNKICSQDGYVCPHGGVVGRDPNNNCEFRACPAASSAFNSIAFGLGVFTLFSLVCIAARRDSRDGENEQQEQDVNSEVLEEVPVEAYAAPPPVNFAYYYTPLNEQGQHVSIYDPNPYSTFSRN